jgi:molybdopterin-guanine dinucleotide biosynthesis protein A
MMGAVLAGGESRRMGQSKALMDWGGQPLAERQRQVLAAVCSHTVVVASQENFLSLQPHFSQLIADRHGGKGPLAGIHAALLHTVEVGLTRAMVLAVDLPGVNTTFLNWIDEQFVGQSALVCRWEGREQPLCGMYSFAILPELEKALSGDHFGVMRFLQHLQGVQWLDVQEGTPGWHARLLTNVNTQHDVEGFANFNP